MKKSKNFKKNKLLTTILGFVSFFGACTFIASCALIPVKNQVDGSKKTNSLALPEDPNNLYSKIHDLSFSVQINNTGGINSSSSSNKVKSSSTFGTSWLFDWKQDSEKPSPEGDINFIGYFATNLHVANLLINPNDNPQYLAPWLKDETSFDGLDVTNSFYLGRYDVSEDKNLNSLNHNSNITYYKLPVLPKTFYTATDFIKLDDPNYAETKPYIDFAILEVSINKYAKPKNIDEVQENEIYDNWIVPAVNDLKSIPGGYTSLFNYTDYFSDSGKSNPFPKNIYIGGYPFYEWSTDQQVTDPYYIDGYKSEFRGSSAWTINSIKGEKDDGQPSEADSISSNWRDESIRSDGSVYLANTKKRAGLTLNYHGSIYRQYGLVYIVKSSNLKSGASGSLSLIEGPDGKIPKILGIYFGTIVSKISGSNGQSTNIESTSGLVFDLILPNVSSYLADIGVKPYDLIAGNADMNPKGSYKGKLEADKTYTHLFPNPADGSST